MGATEIESHDTESLWRNRDFNLLWSSQSLSDLGASATFLALPLLVLSVTGSAVDAGVAGTTYAVATAVLRLPGGALADRWSRRRVMQVSDAARAVLLTVLLVTIALDRVTLPLILAVAAGLGGFTVLFSPAESASIPRLVPERQISQAYAQNEARQYGVSLAGPPLGGLLFGISRAAPFVLDLVTYVLSFVAVSALRGPIDGRPGATETRHFLAQIAEGLSHVRRSDFLRGVVAVAAPLNFAITGVLFAVTVVLRQEGHAASTIGIALAIAATGGLIGAFTAPALIKRFSLRRLVVAIAWILVACLLATSTLTGNLLMVSPLAAALFLAPAANAALFGHLAQTTPDELLARVISVVVFMATTAASLAPLIVGAAIEHLSPTTAVLLCAGAAMLSAAAATISRGLRHAAPSA